MIRPASEGLLVLRPVLGCAAAAYSLLIGGPIGAIAVVAALGALGLLQATVAGWAIGVGAAVGVGITVYFTIVRGRQAKIVIDSDAVTVTGLGGNVSKMQRSEVGWIEMAKGSMVEFSLTEGFSGEGHIDICGKSGHRRIELSVDHYTMSHAEAMARELRVPILLSRPNDRRRWWWTGRLWQEVKADAPAAPISEEVAVPIAGGELLRNLRPTTIVVAVLALALMAAYLIWILTTFK